MAGFCISAIQQKEGFPGEMLLSSLSSCCPQMGWFASTRMSRLVDTTRYSLQQPPGRAMLRKKLSGMRNLAPLFLLLRPLPLLPSVPGDGGRNCSVGWMGSSKCSYPEKRLAVVFSVQPLTFYGRDGCLVFGGGQACYSEAILLLLKWRLLP